MSLSEIEVRDSDWRLGNYQILEEIGRGGMGVIYRARQRHSRRIVALKRILAYHADSQETLARFRREAEAAAHLDHPNILPIYEVGQCEDELPFFSMKFAAGGNLVEAGHGSASRAAPCRGVDGEGGARGSIRAYQRHPASRSETGEYSARWARRTVGERFRSGQMAR